VVKLLRQAADMAESPEGEARRGAARRALQAEPEALPVLLAALERDDPGIVTASLEALVAMGGPAALPVAGLLDRAEARVRRRAAWVLKAQAHPEVEARLIEAARADGDPLVRAYALEALRPRASGPEARPVLLAALGREADWIVRLGAARGLKGADEADVLEVLAAALGDAHFSVRAAAQEGLAAAGEAARPALARRASPAEAGGGQLEAIARRHTRALLGRLAGR
jgi:HEAT repeat protein